MSRKNKNKQVPDVAPVKNEIPREIKNEGQNMISNGLSEAIMGFNPLTMGAQLSQADTLFKNNRWYLISNMRQLLSQIYVEHGLVQTVVDIPVDDAFRGGVDIKTKQLSEDQLNDLKVQLERQDILSSVVGRALKWNRLYGGAAIVIITDQDPATPLEIEKINEKTPLEFRAVDMWELYWDKQNIDESQQGAQILPEDWETYNYYGTKLHKSRVLRMKGLTPPSFIRPRLRGWGFSIVESLVRSINQYLKANDLTFEVLDEFKIDIYKIKNLTQSLLSKNGTELIQKRVQLANQQKNYQNAITMDAEDDYSQKEMTFAGIAETMVGIRMQVASDLRMPLTKIFGISAAGFSSGEDDIENYNAMVESSIRSKAKYDILRLIEIMCQKMFGMVPDDLSIEFKPLRILSAEQEENVKTQKFSRLLQAKQAGYISNKEFREAVNKDNLLPIQLDASVEEIDLNPEASESDSAEGEKSPESKLVAKDAPTAKNSFNGPRIVTVGLISGDEILCGRRRDNGLWTNPGGHIDAGEDIRDAAVREVREETGLVIDRNSLKHLDSAVLTSHRTGKEFVVHAFTASVNKKEATNQIDPDKEFEEFRWVKITPEAPELQPENRHAQNDLVLKHLFKDHAKSFAFQNKKDWSDEYYKAAYDASGGDLQFAPWKKRLVDNPSKENKERMEQAREAAKRMKKTSWQFVLWWFIEHGGKI